MYMHTKNVTTTTYNDRSLQLVSYNYLFEYKTEKYFVRKAYRSTTVLAPRERISDPNRYATVRVLGPDDLTKFTSHSMRKDQTISAAEPALDQRRC